MKLTMPSLGLLAAIAGCAAPPPPIPIAQARAALIGRPASSVSACMGAAPLQDTRGSVALWSYPAATPTAASIPNDPGPATFQYTPLDGDPLGEGLAMSSLGVSEGPVPRSGCMVNVTFDSGIVRAVGYVGPDGHMMRADPECSRIVRACVP